MRPLFVLLLALPAFPQNYTATRQTVDTIETVRLTDARHKTTVSILPTFGNIAYEMLVNGHNVLHFPAPSLAAFVQKPQMGGIPLLAPFADRLDEPAFYANGRRYPFDRSLKNIHFDAHDHPIHGFLTLAADWQVTRLQADATGAQLTSRLDVARRPEWMAQFPFPHVIEMTYLLQDGTLEVRTKVTNNAKEPMPLAIGFHSFFQLTDTPRSQWRAAIPARTEWTVNDQLLPTGRTRPLTELIATPADFPLANRDFDNGFADLIRDRAGRATFLLTGKKQKLEIQFGPNYTTGEIYAPANSGFLCFETMTAINNGLNLAHRGVYKELQSIAPGKAWQESFWIRPSGF